jgi:hypothetical protein
MTQTLYVHMNKRKKRCKLRQCISRAHALHHYTLILIDTEVFPVTNDDSQLHPCILVCSYTNTHKDTSRHK